MRRTVSALRVSCLAAVAAGLLAATARADGLPVLGVDVGPTGVATRTGNARYVTLPVGQQTLVARVDPHGGRVLGSRLVGGSFTIPAVAYDGSAGGLSADGRTLVLIEPRQSFPRAETTFRILTTPWLRALRLVRLHGDFSFDAISPDGALMYLIEYTNPADPTRYLVRAYDVRAGRLLGRPIVDPRERNDKMRGSPLTRISSPDGRYAYTLYDGAGGTPFIHALDTSGSAARCIDLEALAGNNHLSQLRLQLGGNGHTLTVLDSRATIAVIDTFTRSISIPTPGRTTPARSAQEGFPTGFVALAGGVILAALAVLGVALRPRWSGRRASGAKAGAGAL